VYDLANIKSAKKRILVNETKALRNKAIKSKVKTTIKKVDAAVAAGDKDLAKTSLLAAKLIKQHPKVFIIRILLQEKFPV